MLHVGIAGNRLEAFDLDKIVVKNSEFIANDRWVLIRILLYQIVRIDNM